MKCALLQARGLLKIAVHRAIGAGAGAGIGFILFMTTVAAG